MSRLGDQVVERIGVPTPLAVRLQVSSVRPPSSVRVAGPARDITTSLMTADSV